MALQRFFYVRSGHGVGWQVRCRADKGPDDVISHVLDRDHGSIEAAEAWAVTLRDALAAADELPPLPGLAAVVGQLALGGAGWAP